MKGIRNLGRGVVVLFGVGFLVGGCEEKNSAEKPAPEEETRIQVGSEISDPKEEEKPATIVEGERKRDAASEVEEKPERVPERNRVERKPERPTEPWTVAHAGFAKKLTPQSDFYLDARKLEVIWKWLEEAGSLEGARKFLTEILKEAEGSEEIQKLVGEGMGVLPDLFEEEAFFATRGMTWSWETAMGANTWIYRAMGSTLASGMASGNVGRFFEEEDPLNESMMKGLGEWIEKRMAEEGGFPEVAIYAGGRVQEEKRAAVVKWLKEVLALVAKEAPALEPMEFEKSGVKWSGFEVMLSNLEGFDNPLPDGLDPGQWNELRRKIENWSVVVACAEVDDYVVIAMGNGKESIELCEEVENSLAMSEGFKFFEGHDAKEVVSTFWASREFIAAMHEGTSYLPFFEGALEGLKDTALERGAEIMKSLGEFNRHWKARRSGTAHEWVGTVLGGDEIRVESRGGWVSAGVDLETPLRFTKAFSGLEKAPFIRAHWKKKAAYLDHGHKQVEAGMRFLKLVGAEVMDAFAEVAPDPDGDKPGDQFQRWKRDLTRGLGDIWKGYRDHFSKAFGEESAFVMDLEGEMVPAVGVEEEVVKNGRIPRVALVWPVVKREALSESWDIWQGALTNLFGIIAESIDQPIPFPDTMTAEKNDLRTYFFPFPFASDDFLPSVSISDDLFILGSSKTLSENLYEASLDAKGGEEEAGLWVDVDADALWGFCGIWLDVYEKRKAAGDEIEEDDLKREREREDLLDEDPKADEPEDAPRRNGGNPLLKELFGEGEDLPESLPEGEEGPQGEGGDAPEDHQQELKAPEEEGADEGPEELLIEEELQFGGPLSPFGVFLDGGPNPEFLRSFLNKLRVFRGFRYHRRMEDGVPRAILRVKLGG